SGAGIDSHRNKFGRVSDTLKSPGGHLQTEFEIGDFDAVGGESRRIRLADARGCEAGDLEAHRGLRSRLTGDIGDRDRAAQQGERHLAVARLAARRTNLLKRGLDLAGDTMLDVEFVTEETSGCDRDHGDHAAQYLYHSVSSDCRLRGGQFAVVC